MTHLSRILLLGSLYLFTQTSLAHTPVGQVLATKGEVFALNAKQQKRALKRGEKLYQGEVIHTGNDSRMQYLTRDKSLVHVRPESEAKLTTYRYQPGHTASNLSVIDVEKGSVRAITGNISKEKPRSFQIRTPLAHIKVVGSVLTVKTTDDRTILGMDQGSGEGVVLGSNTSHTVTSTGFTTYGEFDRGDYRELKLAPYELLDSVSDSTEIDFKYFRFRPSIIEDDPTTVNTEFVAPTITPTVEFPLVAATTFFPETTGMRMTELSADPDFGLLSTQLGPTVNGHILIPTTADRSVTRLTGQANTGLAFTGGVTPGVVPMTMGAFEARWGYWNNNAANTSATTTVIGGANAGDTMTQTSSNHMFWIGGSITPAANRPNTIVAYDNPVFFAGTDQTGTALALAAGPGANLSMVLDIPGQSVAGITAIMTNGVTPVLVNTVLTSQVLDGRIAVTAGGVLQNQNPITGTFSAFITGNNGQSVLGSFDVDSTTNAGRYRGVYHLQPTQGIP